MFATFTAPGRSRGGTQVLSATKPEGPYEPWSDGPVTPPDWECLDGTLHVDHEGGTMMVFCHEWKQVHDGTILAQRLSPDLRHAMGEPIFLFSASEAPWARALDVPSVRERESPPRMSLTARSCSGLAAGGSSCCGPALVTRAIPWALPGASPAQCWDPGPRKLSAVGAPMGGHGMIGRALDGSLFLTLHQPNNSPHERAAFFPLRELKDTVVLASAEPAPAGPRHRS